MEKFAKQPDDIVDIHVKLKEVDDIFWGGKSRVMVFEKENLPGRINCSNPRCQEGGVSINELIKDAIKERKEFAEAKKKCSGYEGSPKGRIKRKSCIHAFEVTVHIRYVDA